MSQTQNKGLFIAVEGIDGAGKSTLRDWIIKWFEDLGVRVVRTREPGGTPEAELLRTRILLDRESHMEQLSPIAKTMMHMACRAMHVDTLIRPALDAGKIVVTDRFCDSTFTYQNQEGVRLSTLQALHELAFNDFYPDLTFVLDGDPEVFAERLSSRPGESNYYDRASPEFRTNSRNVYQQLAKTSPWRYAVIDAEQSEQQVHAQVIPHLMRLFNEYNKRPKA